MTGDGALSPDERARFRGHLGHNLMLFARALRAAGLTLGTGQILDAERAVIEAGVETREDVYWALAACFVRRREDLVVFDEAFELFFRDPYAMSQALGALLSRTSVPDPNRGRPPSASKRVKEALARGRPPPQELPGQRDERRDKRLDYDITMTASSAEAMATRDFEKMSAEETRLAADAVRKMELPRRMVQTRRLGPDARGTRLDVRRTLQASLRAGSGFIPLRFRGPRERPPPLVALCDVSGSMERYSRMVLHFLHALTRARPRVHSFVFGTRLTNVTRWLRERDVDQALASVGREVTDWAGGTRIGESLRAFNKIWSRRVLGQGALVLLISDGLERGDPALLRAETARLQRSCAHLVWLNPLLRYEGFEPRAGGVKAMLAHVDELRTVHHLQSLQELAQALGGAPTRRASSRSRVSAA